MSTGQPADAQESRDTMVISKTVTISGQKADGNTVELELPADSWKPAASNDITSFERPRQQGGGRQTRALNLNRIGLENQVTAKITDEFAAKNHGGSGDRPDLSNKEDFLLELWLLFISGNILDLKSTNDDTYQEISEFSGYIHNVDWKEEARQENSVYEITLKFKDEVPMNS